MYSSSGKIKRDKTPAEALDVARWLCAKMERTASDMRRSLFRWGVRDADEQNKIIAILVREQFVDHRRYAAAFVRDKLSAGRWGAAKIVFALKQKGIEEEIIQESMLDNVDNSAMFSKLKLDLTKWYVSDAPKAKDPYILRQRLFRRAASRGFDLDDINTILNSLFND
ncbi:MAG: regulatory protein RecX [Mucinivorans sp.]